jgi:probable HAF family extracellular repeat protein
MGSDGFGSRAAGGSAIVHDHGFGHTRQRELLHTDRHQRSRHGRRIRFSEQRSVSRVSLDVVAWDSGPRTLSGDSGSFGEGINNSGEIVGGSVSNAAGTTRAFLWTQSAGMQDLGVGIDSFAYGINSSGAVVGYNLNINAFLWTKAGGLQDLGTLGGSVSEALAINDSSEVVGYSGLSQDGIEDGFLWAQAGGMQNINKVDANAGSLAYSINGLNQVAGSIFSPLGAQSTAFVWTQSRGMKLLGTGSPSGAFGINAAGEVVGSMGRNPPNAFLWTSTRGVQNLNALIPPASGWVLNQASAINRSGQIVAFGTINGETHAALLTPTN